MALYQLRFKQIIPASLEDVWDFISSPGNLKKITPDYMGFEITSGELADKMYPGMMISYKVSPIGGIKLNWVTEITQVENLQYFVDEQRVGPYSIWHHQHHLREVAEGIEMVDIISYKPPLGIIGSILNSILIRKKLDEIFNYRFKALEREFGAV